MFFILSKTLLFLIQPLNWIIGLMIYSLWTKHPKRKRKAIWIALVMLLFFTNHFIFNQFIRWWEPETITADQIVEPYDVGILLGGYSNFFIRPNEHHHNFNRAADRFTQTYELYKKGKIRKIMLSGGSGDLIGEQVAEAHQIRQLLLDWGVPDSCIIVENNSRNTHENATMSKEILAAQYPGQKYLLITSAFHMPRAARCFQKEQLNFTPYCVDYFSEYVSFRPAALFIPNRDCLYRWEAIIKEIFGLLAYRLRGYI